jgi:hypothetical protein
VLTLLSAQSLSDSNFPEAAVSDGFFLAIIAAHDKLEFDVHRKTPPGLSGGCMMQATLPEFVEYPQHLHALLMLRAKPLTPKTTIYSPFAIEKVPTLNLHEVL